MSARAARGVVRHSGLRLWIARRAEHLETPFRVAQRLARLVAEAVPVGLLRRDEIAAVVWDAYTEVPDFYDPAQYPLRYEEALLPLLARHAGGTRLIDLYCGQGREAEIFSRAGFDVLGVDAQQHSIDRARRHAREAAFDARFVASDVAAFEPGDERWDVVYSSLWMYSTIPDRAARRAWLEQLSRWVAPGGVLVLSTMPCRSRLDARLRHAVACTVAALCFNPRRPEPGDRFHTRLFWHDFTPDEVVEELAQAGLDRVDGLAIEGGTPCVFHVARARGADRGSPR